MGVLGGSLGLIGVLGCSWALLGTLGRLFRGSWVRPFIIITFMLEPQGRVPIAKKYILV